MSRLSSLIKSMSRPDVQPDPAGAEVSNAEMRRLLLSGQGQSDHEICATLREGRNGLATHEDIYFCFRLLLGRDINPEEINGHMQAVGHDLTKLVSQFLRSREFDVRDLLSEKAGAVILATLPTHAMYVDPEDDAVGKYVLQGEYEKHVTGFFKQSVKPGDTVLDIGANIGFFTMLAATLTGPQGQVFAVEPNMNNCRLIQASIRHNIFDHVTLFPVAACEHAGPLVLNSAYSNGSVAAPADSLATLMRSQIVAGMVLDDVLKLDRLDFVKIDVEGFELTAMKGLRKHLDRFRPTIVSEFSPGTTSDALDYLSYLQSFQYELGVLHFNGDVEYLADRNAIMDVWRVSGVDHIDIVARPQ